ncbi:EspA/EspE family type VII secretion system effector [Actinokineospora spheciospongiae]|nr:EspA/EspE family type VII secretion system effector [Actinokineospora spheciospongiae]
MTSTTQTTSTASGPRTAEQGAQNITNDITSVKSAIERGDWLEAGMSITNVAMDVIGIAGDPLSAAGSAGFGWIIQHISFLRKPFEALFGSAESILGSSSGWGKTGSQLTQTAEQLRQASVKETGNWTGVAADGYRKAAATQAQGLDALAEVSKAIGETIKGAGQLLAEVRKTVLDFINKCVMKVIQIIIEALAKAWLSFGASIAEGIARSIAEAVQTAQKIASKIQKFVSSLQKIMQAVQKIVQLAKAVKQLLATIGGKAAGTAPAATTQAPQVNPGQLDTAANTQYSNNGQTNQANYNQGQVPGYGGYQPLPGGQQNTANYGQRPAPGYGGYQQPGGGQTNPANYGQTPAPSYGGYQQPTGGGSHQQPSYGQQPNIPSYGGYQQPTGGSPYTNPGVPTTGVPGQVSQVTPPGGWGPSGPPPTPGAPASMVDRARWIGSAVEILINHGVDPSKIDAGQIAQIVDRASGGNPHAVDLSGPGATDGNPPKGMLQVTDSQFQQHQVPGHGNIWEPIDNMLAGVRHILQEWGSIMVLLEALNSGDDKMTIQA